MVLFWSFFSLEAIITALIVTRILEQFVAQVFAVVLLRNEYVTRGIATAPDDVLVEIVDEVYVPLVRARGTTTVRPRQPKGHRTVKRT